MKRTYEEEYVQAEQKNAWFVKRKELVLALLGNENKKSALIEVGCGSGYILDYLNKKGFKNVEGVDSSKYFLKYYKNIRKNTAIPNKKYDVVLLLDVIEHVKTEKDILEKVKKLMKENGKLIISAPAYMSLWSHHDELNKHYRRYDSKSLKNTLLKSGFDVKKTTYWNTIMMPAIWLLKKMQNAGKSKASNIESTPAWFNGLYKLILGFENLLIKIGIRLPFGVSIFAIAKKK